MRLLPAVLSLTLVLAAGPGSRSVHAQEPLGAQPVDVALVLAIDSSSSVSMDEFYLQLQGYAAAFRHPDLAKAIRSGRHGALALTLFEWSGPSQQAINFEWRRLDDEASLKRLADELAQAPRLIVGGGTAIGAAIDFAVDLLARAPHEAGRLVIDISGDGASNQGRPVGASRADALVHGITVNALAILNEDPELVRYFEAAIIGGPGAFVIAAGDYSDFADAILRKLIREITTLSHALRDTDGVSKNDFVKSFESLMSD